MPGNVCQYSVLTTLPHCPGPHLSYPAPLSPAPLPMAHIEKLAADCMRDVEEVEDEEDGLEEDADLLVCLPGWCQGLHRAARVCDQGSREEVSGVLVCLKCPALPYLGMSSQLCPAKILCLASVLSGAVAESQMWSLCWFQGAGWTQ